jgi:hypothetical protein
MDKVQVTQTAIFGWILVNVDFFHCGFRGVKSITLLCRMPSLIGLFFNDVIVVNNGDSLTNENYWLTK